MTKEDGGRFRDALRSIEELCSSLDDVEGLSLDSPNVVGFAMSSLPGKGIHIFPHGTLIASDDGFKRAPRRVPVHWITYGEEHWTVHVFMPGCPSENIRIKLSGNTISVQGHGPDRDFSLEVELPFVPGERPFGEISRGYLKVKLPVSRRKKEVLS